MTSYRRPPRSSVATRGHAHEEVFQITGVRPGLSEDVDNRARRYLVSMSLRSVCFIAGVLVDGWLRWVFLAGAVLLPYIAVVLANGGRENAGDRPLPTVAPPPRRALPAQPTSSRHDDYAA